MIQINQEIKMVKILKIIIKTSNGKTIIKTNSGTSIIRASTQMTSTTRTKITIKIRIIRVTTTKMPTRTMIKIMIIISITKMVKTDNIPIRIKIMTKDNMTNTIMVTVMARETKKMELMMTITKINNIIKKIGKTQANNRISSITMIGTSTTKMKSKTSKTLTTIRATSRVMMMTKS